MPIESETKIKGLSSLESAIEECYPVLQGKSTLERTRRRKLGPKTARFPKTRLPRVKPFMAFILCGLSRIANPPKRDDQVAWLHLAQHYELPTRLLDWALSPLVALHFAVCDRDSETNSVDGCLWALNSDTLNQDVSRTPDEPTGLVLPDDERAVVLARTVFCGRSKEQSSVLAMGIGEIDLRMLVQQLLFTIHGGPDDLRDYPEEAMLRKLHYTLES